MVPFLPLLHSILIVYSNYMACYRHLRLSNLCATLWNHLPLFSGLIHLFTTGLLQNLSLLNLLKIIKLEIIKEISFCLFARQMSKMPCWHYFSLFGPNCDFVYLVNDCSDFLKRKWRLQFFFLVCVRYINKQWNAKRTLLFVSYSISFPCVFLVSLFRLRILSFLIGFSRFSSLKCYYSLFYSSPEEPDYNFLFCKSRLLECESLEDLSRPLFHVVAARTYGIRLLSVLDRRL